MLVELLRIGRLREPIRCKQVPSNSDRVSYTESIYLGKRLCAIASSRPLRKLIDSGAE